MSTRRNQFHLFYWCAECGKHCTNYYPSELWAVHQEDLKDAKLDILVCPQCQVQREYFARFAGDEPLPFSDASEIKS